MTWNILRLLRTRTSRPHPAARKRFRPTLEAFEDRCLPSTFSWFQNVDGNFNDPARWHDQNGMNGVPGPADDAVIGGTGFTVTSSEDHSVRSLNSNSRLTVAAGTFTVGDPINNSSLFQLVVSSGASFQVTEGTTFLTGGTESLGSFNVTPGAALAFTGGTHHIDTGTSLGGGGSYILSGGTLSIDADVNAPQDFRLAGGTLAGAGTFTVSNTTMRWTAGTMTGPGQTVIDSTGALSITGPDTKLLSSGYTLTTNGAVTWSGAGGIRSDFGPFITNSGTWTVQGDLALFVINGPDLTFTNTATGVFTKASGNGALSIADIFNNAGTVNVNSGTLQLSQGSFSTGSFDLATGAALQVTAGTHTLAGGTTVTGGGTVRVDGGTLLVNADVEVPNFEMSSGTLGGTNTLTVDSNFTWTGGTMAGLGQAVSNGSMTITGPDTKFLSSGYTLTTNGAVTWSGAGGIRSDFGPAISNSGTWTVQGDLALFVINGPDLTFTNTATGVFTKTSGTGALTVNDIFNNAGTVNVNSGAVQLSQGGFSTGAYNIALAGTALQFTGGTHTLSAGARLPSAGLVEVNGGALVVDAAVSVQSFVLTSGSLRLTSNGMLNVGGDYTQRVGTTLFIDIGGLTAGAGYGQLNVTGAANLDGTLTVTLTNDFSPSIGDSYQILTFGARNGDFGTYNLPNLGTDRHFNPVSGPNSLTTV
jgi:hypothetical protein